MTRSFQPGTLALAVARTENAKLGDAATTYAAQASCPSDCAFLDGGGCYAETGQVGKFVTAPLNESAASADALAVAEAEAEAIDALVGARPLRLHTVGDCASDDAASVVSAAADRYRTRGGGPVWTYTHGWRETARESWGTVSVLASCETAGDVALARSRGYATAIVVEQFESDKLYALDGGGSSAVGRLGAGQPPESLPSSVERVLPCPAQTRDVACSDCRLCFDDQALRDRGYSIGFELHGIPYAIRQARLALRRPDDPRRRDTIEVQLRALLDERPTINARQAADELLTSKSYAQQLLSHFRNGADHPTVKRQQRYKRSRDQLLGREQDGPCDSFNRAYDSPRRGTQRCDCGWTLRQHHPEARAA